MDLSSIRKQVKSLKTVIANKKERFYELSGERKALLESLNKIGVKTVKAAEREAAELKKEVKEGKTSAEEEIAELIDKLSWEDDEELLERISSEED